MGSGQLAARRLRSWFAAAAPRRIVFGAAALLVWALLAATLPRGLPLGVVVLGAVTGALASFTALGLVLIYRSSRIVNFAQAEIGGVAAGVAVLLVSNRGLNYFIAVPIGLAIALLIGAVIEVTVVRRFSQAPRLILTVATVGLAQMLAGVILLLPSLLGRKVQPGTGFALELRPFTTPFRFRQDIAPVSFNGNHLLAVIGVVGVLVGLIWLFNRTDAGIGVRGAADSPERAMLLGIPVRRLSLITWVIAAGLSGLAGILTAGVLGSNTGTIGVGPAALLAPLAAAVLARFESLTMAFAASIGIGVFSQGVFWSYPRSTTVDLALFGLILVGLLVQRRKVSRVAGEDLGGFEAAHEARPIPKILRALPEVRRARIVGVAVVALVVLGLPLITSRSNTVILGFIAIYAIIGVSLVVLTGWAGQVSLGQFAFVGLGAATTGSLLVHTNWDFLICLLVACAAGAGVALVIGVPALRVPGLFLAPATIAFAVATSSYVINPATNPEFAPLRVTPPFLFDRFDLSEPRVFYFFSLSVLAVAVVLARNFRRTRIGRVVIAARDNERFASALSISTVRVKLIAFAFSGALAGLAGGLYVLAIRGIPFGGFSPQLSLQLFTMVVVGGLTSILGAILGALYVYFAQYLLTGAAELFATGAGLVVLLMFLPGGLAEAINSVRDWALRRVARRHRLDAPTLEAGEARTKPRYLAGLTESCPVEALLRGGDQWKRVWKALGKAGQKQVRRYADWGQAVHPPEFAAIAVGRVRSRRRFQNRRFFPLLPLIPAFQIVQFAWAQMVQTQGRSYVEELQDQFTSPWLWANVAFVVVLFPIWQRVAGYRAERLNLALVAEAPTDVPLNGGRGSEVGTARPAALLECFNVDAGYGHLQALFGVDLAVQEEEILALLGTNGAGKSTALRVIGGAMMPMGGNVLFDGENVTWMDPIERVQRGIVLIPSKGVFGSLSVRENLHLAGWLARRNGDHQFIESSMNRVFKLFPVLKERLDQKAALLSGGEQQMLALAQGLLCRPRLLMIDELSLGLAPKLVSAILEVVRELNRSGISILIVEQSINLSTTIAGRAEFMEKGQIRFSGLTSELVSSELVRSVFFREKAGSKDGSQATRVRAGGNGQGRGADQRVIFSAKGITKRYGGVTAVADLDLQIHAGQILGVIGSNGAGKTTAFDVFSGFIAPDAGAILYNGVEITGASAADRALLGFGRTFQDLKLLPSLTVTETIAVSLERQTEVREPIASIFYFDATARSERSVQSRVDELIDNFGLGRYRDTRVADLSTGTRRVLELACVAGHRPSLLLLDEPSSGLSQAEAEKMAEIVRNLAQATGSTLAIIEHDVPLVAGLADELVCMDLGRIIARGKPNDVLTNPDVIASYLGTDQATIARSGKRLLGAKSRKRPLRVGSTSGE